MDFTTIIAAVSEEDRQLIMRRLKERHDFVTSADYVKEYDDVTSYLYWEIGDALYGAAYPPEPEPEVIPEPLPIPGDGEELYYCRRCQAPRIFKREAYRTPPPGTEIPGIEPESLTIYELVCSVCGRVRAWWRTTHPISA